MVRLGDRAWPDLAGRRIGLLVPVGSCEQHGPHLPLDTDTRIAVAIAEAACAGSPLPTLVSPPVAIGASGEHAGFPGTLSIGTAVLTEVLVEVARSALPARTGGSDLDAAPDQPFAWVLLVNGHGGNVDAVRAAVERLRAESRKVSAWSPRFAGGDAHAGRTETSLMLAIDRRAVLDARPRGNDAPLTELIAGIRAGGVRSVSDTGVLGDSAGASADEGAALLSRAVHDLVAAIAAMPPAREHDTGVSSA